MSIEINWDILTTGSDGIALAESIRESIHEKFQQVELPRFIRSVQVHSFEFGEECPKIELKDVCDPLPDFYEDDEDDEDNQNQGEDADDGKNAVKAAERAEETLRWRREADRANRNGSISSASSRPPAYIDTRLPGLRSNLGLADNIASPLLSRSNTPGIHTPGIPGGYTPGIPGGTSNLNYFHLPLSAGLSGSQTPLAAVASGNPYSAGWADHAVPPWDNHIRQHSPQRHQQPQKNHSYADPSSRPSTADSFQAPSQHHRQNSLDGIAQSPPPRHPQPHTPDPSDLQIVLHIAYTGSVRLSLTAEILLDYPMPSFVAIPLKLNITGLSFDGVALIAYLRKRAHFCFLGPEDAEALVGAEGLQDDRTKEGGPSDLQRGRASGHGKQGGIGGLLKEIKVESEIGQKEGGKQVLKNVGKVEKFVLEQVRRIFEDEFVYPSFWTFLV
ncbi:Mitochondrial distribution and morphology protein 12 [Hypocenomyce scalaris]|nr:Mitochondrial distribution and morphology protein 12 [Hypocenomyce scalaris]